MLRVLLCLAALARIQGDTLVAGGRFSTIGPFTVPSLAKFNGWFWDTAFTKTALARGSVVTAGCKSGSVYVFGGNMTAPGNSNLHFLRTSTWYFAGFDDAFFVPPSTLRPTTYGQVFNGDGGEPEAGLFDGLSLDFGEVEFDGSDEEGGEDEPVDPVEPVELAGAAHAAHDANSLSTQADWFGQAHTLPAALGSQYAQFMADLVGSPGSLFCVGGSVLVAAPFSNATQENEWFQDDDAEPLKASPSTSAEHVSGHVGAVGVWSPKKNGFVLLGDPGQLSGLSHAVVGPDVHTVYSGGFFNGDPTVNGISTTVPTSQHSRYFTLSSLAVWTSDGGWQSMGGGAMLPGDNGTHGTQGEIFSMSLYNDTGRVFVGGHCAVCRFLKEDPHPSGGSARHVPVQCFSYVAVWENDMWVGDTDFGAALNGTVTALRYEHAADVLHVGGLFRWCTGRHCMSSAASMAILGDYSRVGWHIPSPSDIVPCGFVSSVARLSNHTAAGGALKLVTAAQCDPFSQELRAMMDETRGKTKLDWTAIAEDLLTKHFSSEPFCGVAWAPTAGGALSGEWGCAGATDGPIFTMYAYADVGPKGFTVALIVCLSLLGAVLGCGALVWGVGTLYYMACTLGRQQKATGSAKSEAAKKGKPVTSDGKSVPKTAPKKTGTAAAATTTTTTGKAGSKQSASASIKTAMIPASTPSAASKKKLEAYSASQTMAWGGFHAECLMLARWWGIASAAVAGFDLLVVLPVSVTMGAGNLDGVGSLFTKRQWVPDLYVDVCIGASLALPPLVFLVVMIAAHAAKMYPDPNPTAWLKNHIQKAAPVALLGPLKRWTLKNDTPQSMAQLQIMHSVFASRIAPTVTIVLVTCIWTAMFTAAAFLAPMPLAIVQLSPTWGPIAYSLGLVMIAKLCDLLITYLHAPVMPAKSTLVLRLMLRACLSLAQSSLIALNPGVKLSSLLTPLVSAAADYIMLGGLTYMYQQYPSPDHLATAPLGAKVGLVSKLAVIVGHDASNPIATWDLAAEGRVVRLCGFIVDFFLLGGYTLVFQLQLSFLFALDFFAFMRIAQYCTNPILRKHQLITGTVPRNPNTSSGSLNGANESQLPLLENAASGAAAGENIRTSAVASATPAPVPSSCTVQTAASHSSLFGKDVRGMHVLCALIALALSGFASPGSFVSVGGQAWVPPAAAAMALTLLGVRQAVSTFFDAPPKLLENGLVLVVLFFVLSWATLDGFALTVSYAHAFSITAVAPLITFTVVFHGVILLVVFSLWCCTPKKETPLTTRRMVLCCGVRYVDPQHAMFRYTRSRKPLFSCLRSK